MPVQRAVYERETIRKWRLATQRHAKLRGIFGGSILLAAVIAGGFALIEGSAAATLACTLLAFCGVIVIYLFTLHLRCPRCGKRPGDLHTNALQMDVCNHCQVWLISPYAQDYEPDQSP